MKTLKLEDKLTGEIKPIKIIDEAIEIDYSSMDKLLNQFNKDGEIPIIIINGFSTCSMLYRVKTPFIKTDKTHPVYQFDEKAAIEQGHRHDEFKGPELVAELAHKGESQIVHWVTGEAESYPDAIAESWDIVFNNYAVILPKEPNYVSPYPHYLIAGEENCRKQLKEWGIDNVGYKKNWFDNTEINVEGLL